VSEETGSIEWKVDHSWRLTEYLPPAVVQFVEDSASNLLLEPQKRLGEQLGLLQAHATEEPPAAGARDMTMDGKDDEAMEEDEDGDAEHDRDVVMEAADAVPEAISDQQTAKALEELRTWIKEVWFEEQSRTLLKYISGIQAERQRELVRDAQVEDLLPDDDSDEELAGNDAEDPHAAAIRRQQRLRERVEKNWSFPEVPGRKAAPGAIDFEVLRAIIQIYKLDDSITDEVEHLRDRMCQKVRVSSFQHGLDFEKPNFPLILRDVACERCCVASHVDVTSHPTRAPGLWVCTKCNSAYEKDGMEARLIDLLHNIIQAWHAQEIVCKKCRGLRTSQMQEFCECFGRYQVSFKETDFRLLLQVLRSLTGPHHLSWLQETLDSYAGVLP